MKNCAPRRERGREKIVYYGEKEEEEEEEKKKRGRRVEREEVEREWKRKRRGRGERGENELLNTGTPPTDESYGTPSNSGGSTGEMPQPPYQNPPRCYH